MASSCRGVLWAQDVRDVKLRAKACVGGFDGVFMETDGASGNELVLDGVGQSMGGVTLAQLRQLAQEFGTDDIAVSEALAGVRVVVRGRTR